MMGGLCPRPGYQPLPQSHILEICPDNTVRVSTEDNQELVIKVSTEPRPSSPVYPLKHPRVSRQATCWC